MFKSTNLEAKEVVVSLLSLAVENKRNKASLMQ
jgi:hypothetical protein